MINQMYYAVHKGRQPGVYHSWDQCQKQILGYKGAIFRKFSDRHEAEMYYQYGTYSAPDSEPRLRRSTVSAESEPTAEPKCDDESLHIYTDGSCIRERNYAGYAYIIPTLGIEGQGEIAEPKTNNRAELTAVIKALSQLPQSYPNPITIFTDSKYVILIATGTGARYRSTNYQQKDGSAYLNSDLIAQLLDLMNNFPNITFRHVRAHTGRSDVHSVWNHKVDYLSRCRCKD